MSPQISDVASFRDCRKRPRKLTSQNNPEIRRPQPKRSATGLRSQRLRMQKDARLNPTSRYERGLCGRGPPARRRFRRFVAASEPSRLLQCSAVKKACSVVLAVGFSRPLRLRLCPAVVPSLRILASGEAASGARAAPARSASSAGRPSDFPTRLPQFTCCDREPAALRFRRGSAVLRITDAHSVADFPTS